MIPFLILLVTPFVLQHTKQKRWDYERKNRSALIFFFGFLLMLLMLRHESVGNDTQNYIYIFNRIRENEWGSTLMFIAEPGFTFYTKIVSLFTADPHMYLAITAAITVAMILPTYLEMNEDTSLSVALFSTMSTFVMMFSGIRQMLAIGIGFVAFYFVRKRKVWPYVIAVVIAVTFHTSAIMLAVMYPLYHVRITKKWLYAVVPAMMLVFVFNRQIFGVLTAILSRYTRFEASTSSTGAFTTLILFAIFVVFAFLIPDEEKLDAETIGLRNFLLLSLVVQMFAPLHMLAMRMNYYYIIFIPLLIPKIIKNRSERWNEVAVTARHIMVAFFMIYFFVSAYNGGALNVFPYHFLWEKV